MYFLVFLPEVLRSIGQQQQKSSDQTKNIRENTASREKKKRRGGDHKDHLQSTRRGRVRKEKMKETKYEMTTSNILEMGSSSAQVP